MDFCEYLRQATADCSHCYENRVNLCAIKLGLQPYYSDFKICDSVTISRDHFPIVETDIEITYKTQYPYAEQAGKGAEFSREQMMKEKAIRTFFQDNLPPGAVIKPCHLHYHPDMHDPELVALHIHILKRTEDLDEAIVAAKQIVYAIQPREIEEAIHYV